MFSYVLDIPLYQGIEKRQLTSEQIDSIDVLCRKNKIHSNMASTVSVVSQKPELCIVSFSVLHCSNVRLLLKFLNITFVCTIFLKSFISQFDTYKYLMFCTPAMHLSTKARNTEGDWLGTVLVYCLRLKTYVLLLRTENAV